MFKIKKTFEIAIAHHLNLGYDSPCRRIHGHNLQITIYLASKELNEAGMVMDFTQVKKKIHDKLDHQDLNEIKGIGCEVKRDITRDSRLDRRVILNPTAERLAEWICSQFLECYRVDVQESTGNIATYEDEDFWIRLQNG
jgi:6-pyruvoyltetrahydropterin/6-carboxytetrahydropterin synthase